MQEVKTTSKFSHYVLIASRLFVVAMCCTYVFVALSLSVILHNKTGEGLPQGVYIYGAIAVIVSIAVLLGGYIAGHSANNTKTISLNIMTGCVTMALTLIVLSSILAITL
jgi:hypothetical protein